MVLPTQFQLGLELTNIVNPISQAVSTLGSLALVDAIKKSGSDSITEMKMASLLGRHRIDEVIKVHFRERVAKSDQSVISRYMDIILEAGSGPTVQEALKNPALFSMIIQLSALSFAHEDESLASAILQAVENIAQELGGHTMIVPDYVSLLGTIRACQQQTVAFRWLPLYEVVEHKIMMSLQKALSKTLNTQSETEDETVEASVKVKPQCIGNRLIPFPVFQALLKWLHEMQGLPEDRLLHLKCDMGISTIIVWCHHILGLDLTVEIEGVNIRFGNNPGNIFIETCDKQGSEAFLMDPADRQQPLFTMDTDSHRSIRMFSESRAEAFGYGRKILERANVSEEDILYSSHWVIAQSIDAASHYFTSDRLENRSASSPSKHDLLRAGQFFFGLHHLDTGKVETYVGKPPSKRKFMKESKRSALIALVLVFARIHQDDLEKCTNMPLSLHFFYLLHSEDSMLKRLNFLKNDYLFLNVVTSFMILSRLLLGHMYSDEYVRPAVLVSAWGWSLFFDSMDASDPDDVPTSTFRAMCGVPTRGGLRRSRIIDGRDTARLADQGREAICKASPIYLCRGIGEAKRGAVVLGISSDAFQVQVTFEWTSEAQGILKHRMGYREMQELCLAVFKHPPCECDSPTSDMKAWIEERACYARDGSNVFGPISRDYDFEVKIPVNSSINASQTERVYAKSVLAKSANPETDGDHSFESRSSRIATWIFHVSQNPAARWLQLYDIWKSYPSQDFLKAFRGQDTCYECSTRSEAEVSPKPTLLLM